ncbi:MAG: HEAT repeat domain-containing protein [Deltaproteobacteria bacterium]|nr:HEAT repeat domain-containing protein [Deltaproteobacteria bacterium]
MRLAISAQRLAARDPAERRRGATALAHLRAPGQTALLAEASHDPEQVVRVESLAAMSGFGQDRWVQTAVLDALQHPDPVTRTAAVGALGNQWFGEHEVLAAALLDAQATGDDGLRLAIARRLATVFDTCQCGTPGHGSDDALLAGALTDASVEVRRAAAKAMEWFWKFRHLDHVLRLTEDADVGIRASGYVALGHFMLRIWQEEWVRSLYAEGVELDEDLVIPAQLRGLEDPEPSVRAATVAGWTAACSTNWSMLTEQGRRTCGGCYPAVMERARTVRGTTNTTPSTPGAPHPVCALVRSTQ